jgi:hypothetical protein
LTERKAAWDRIQIHYEDGYTVYISRKDLETIESISTVIDALNRAQNLTRELRGILKE